MQALEKSAKSSRVLCLLSSKVNSPGYDEVVATRIMISTWVVLGTRQCVNVPTLAFGKRPASRLMGERPCNRHRSRFAPRNLSKVIEGAELPKTIVPDTRSLFASTIVFNKHVSGSGHDLHVVRRLRGPGFNCFDIGRRRASGRFANQPTNRDRRPQQHPAGEIAETWLVRAQRNYRRPYVRVFGICGRQG